MKASAGLYHRIQADIIAGRLKAEEKINEQELAVRFNVSRTPLREALFQLVSGKFLCYEDNKGFRVPALSKEELRECYPIIWSLEIEALKSGFHLLGARLKDLAEINAKFGRAQNQPRRVLSHDDRFHGMICEACGNHTLKEIVTTLKLRVQRYDLVFFSAPGLVQQSCRQHQEIIEQIAERRLEKAANSLEANWRCGLEYFLSRM